MRIRTLKIENLKEKKLVESILGYKFEGNKVGIIAGSLEEIKIQRLIDGQSERPENSARNQRAVD